MSPARRRRPSTVDGVLPPQRKWRAIALSTLLLAPAVWSLLAGVVALGSDDPDRPDAAQAAAAVTLGLALVPFVFIVLAFSSWHPRAPGAVLKAMGLFLLVGIPASAIASDAVTGLVAGVGAGGIAALRTDLPHDLRFRIGAVVLASLYCFVLARTAGAVVVVAAPVFPLTGLGVADHLAEWHRRRVLAHAALDTD